MSEFFLTVVNMSISASWIVLAVLVLRLLLKKAPKWITVALWGIVAVRLVCPFAIESAISLIPSAETISPDIMTDATPEINTGIPAINSPLNPVISDTLSPEIGESVNPLQILIPVLAAAWLVGIAAMLIYTGISYWRIKRKISTAVLYRDNIFQSENVLSPFVLGIVKPKIYLPFRIDEKDMVHVIAHEKAHISRKDHLWKPLGFLLLTLHWFNPVMWLGYVLLCRDIELACDEKVVKKMNTEQRADYSQALLTCSVNRRMIAACPLAFGEIGVKERVKTVLNYKKPAFWIIVVAVAAGVIAAVCFLTNPVSVEDNNNEDTISFGGKTLNKSDLSPETIEWLEWYNGLSETEQIATDYIPHELWYLNYADRTGGVDATEADIIRPVTQPPLSSVKETDDTQLAVVFIRDFYETLINHDENALLLDKYFNAGELKDRMAECKKEMLLDNTSTKKENFAFDYVVPVSDRVVDGVHLITVNYAYHFRYSGDTYDPANPDEGWSGAGMSAPFAIRGGKIVNLEIGEHFKALPSDENTPEVQIIMSDITAAQNGTVELGGKVFKKTNLQRDIVIDESAFIKPVTPNGPVDLNDYNGEIDEVITALKNLSELKNLGNTGKLEVDEVAFNDATIYQLGDKLLVVGEMPSSDSTDMTYFKAMIFAPV